MASAARLGMLGTGPSSVELAGEPRYINRELSTLDFNDRVLAMAENGSSPSWSASSFWPSSAPPWTSSSRSGWLV